MKPYLRIIPILSLLASAAFAYQYNACAFRSGDAIRLETGEYGFDSIPLNSPLRRSPRGNRRRFVSTPTPLPASLYSCQIKTNGVLLSIKRMRGMSGALLLSEPVRYPGLPKPTSFALRSPAQTAFSNDFTITSGKKTLGPEQNLFFLGSRSTINHPQLGESFRIFLPATAVYGYWEKRLFQKKIARGSRCRLLILGDSRRRTYSIRIR